ncbi:hypothetical protein KP509_23G002700 [Ceratopteris richardii]|uniref:Late embryogenesis abundant protein LEA-2 subgroup domain-containing protein n=1 Tax=Ceratopteris richardii TaxID=49495 RepID=A0A8T2RZ96_CERRI|nr:hypothetical protein KP509_23G002700 [Ceratopteris richardii]KAH7300896.1 hypothetical protein KP509_23G002700 [Ceratopteris richardii]
MAYGRLDMPPSYREDEPSQSLCNCCCCVSLSLLFFLLIAIGIALLFILVVKPRKPEFNLESVSVQNFQIEREFQGHSLGVFLSMHITLIFSASNPNKVSIDYSPTQFTCVYRDAILGVAKVPSFHQAAHSHSALTAVVTVEHVNVAQSLSLDLLHDVTSNNRVGFIINGPVEARVKVLGISSPKVEVNVNCRLVVQPHEKQIANRDCDIGQLTLSD